MKAPKKNNRDHNGLMTLVPPQNLEAEEAILGAIMLDRNAFLKASEVIKESDFYREAHRKIFLAMQELFDRNDPIDLLTLIDRLRRFGHLEEVGGESYLAALVDAVPTAASVSHHARLVKEKALLRDLISAATEVIAQAYEGPDDVGAFIDQAEWAIFEVTSSASSSEAGFVKPADLLLDRFRELEMAYEGKPRSLGLPTGFPHLDELTAGLHPGQMIVVGAGTSVGKTAFAARVALNVARLGKRVIFFSAEMSNDEILDRLLALQSGVSLRTIRNGQPNDDEFRRLREAAGVLDELEILINEAASLTPRKLGALCRRVKAEQGADLIVVDYLQLLRPDKPGKSKYEDVTENSRSIKVLAKDMRVSVVVLSQLSRRVSERDGHEPRLSDLRDSGTIEQDADVVLLLHRAEVFEKPGSDVWNEVRGQADLNLAKQRNGPANEVLPLKFLHETADFREAE